MAVRLAFAVAINVDPEILIVDEALSVGDELFQRKCFSRIEAIRKNGATILFVSHSGNAIVELCDRAVLLDAGEKLAIGEPKHIVGHYQKLLYAPGDKRDEIRGQIRQMDGRGQANANVTEAIPHGNPLPTAHEHEVQETFDPNLKPVSTIEYASLGPVIGQPEILTVTGARVNGLVRGRKYRFCYRVSFNRAATNVRFGMSIKTTSGLALGGALSAPSLSESIPLVAAGKAICIEFTFNCCLNPGIYFMNAGVFGACGQEETGIM
jgi:lipopolysaccharide transport system ATP-binding protein